VVSSSGMTYANVVSVPVEKHNIHVTYITTYPPSDTHVFNTAWTALHMLQECIHVLQKWPQDILGSLLTSGTQSSLVARRTRSPYRTIGIILKQTSS
jgi:hypothetical protein